MNNLVGYVFVLIYFIIMIIWAVGAIYGQIRYSEYIKPLDSKKYPGKSFYVIGLAILEWVKYPFDFSFDKKRISQVKVIYGKKYAEYFYRINMAQKVTVALTIIMLSMLLYPITQEFVLILFGVMLAFVAVYYYDTKITSVIDKRDEEILSDFPQVLSKMALLINAGMIMNEAWKNVSTTGKGTLYDEMQRTRQDIENGMSDIDAYSQFGERCGVASVKKFTSMLIQNLTKGNRELSEFLTHASYDSWEEKKHMVKRQGEKAANKLMIPLGMILVGIFIIILVPIVSNLGV